MTNFHCILKSKSSNIGKSSSHKPARKLRTLAASGSSKSDTSPMKQTLISKIMALQEQSTNIAPKSEKPSRKNEEKVHSVHTFYHHITIFLSLLFLPDHQDCDARCCEEVQEKCDNVVGSIATASPIHAKTESHHRVDD